jgi:hypothetical protein
VVARRALTLRREALTALTSGELADVAGASLPHGASLDESCPTLPAYDCTLALIAPFRTNACGL